jgi:D-alanyl-D-alanine carboxypeptidase (penicillin-binding protein 5/6)
MIMSKLQRGQRRLSSLAGASLALCLTAGLAVGFAPTARSETIGGEQLARTHRTVSLQPGAEPLPDVWAETWLLADAQTGEVLAQKASHERRPPASTLKMLTALAVMPNTTPTDTYVATPRAATIYGARVGLKPGKTYTLDELWYAVFLPSANDAAIAVAEANGGVKRTVRQMNKVARDLNAFDTQAKNTSGLDAPGQLSSAYDLALMARAGLQRPDFASYVRSVRAEFPDVKGRGSHPIYTTNRLLLSGWRGAIGVKTGFTSRAGRTFVGAATRGGRTLIVSLMGVKESSEGAAKKLLAWGFTNADSVTPIGTLVEPGPLGSLGSLAEGSSTAVSQAGSSTGGGSSAPVAAESDATSTRVPVVGAVLLVVLVAGAVAWVWRRPSHAGSHAA